MGRGGATDVEWAELLAQQSGAVGRQQALQRGWTAGSIDWQVVSARWRRLHPGVYVTFTGPLPWITTAWAALLHAGPAAALGHRSAARLQGLLDEDPTPIDVVVPWGHRVTTRPGLVVRGSRHLAVRTHPARTPPQTRVEDTVLDLVGRSTSVDEAVGWLTRACQRRVTTSTRLMQAAARRGRLRHRRLLLEVLADVTDGVASPLELRYRRHVEVAHALPPGVRGQALRLAGRRWYADVRYEAYRTRVELEGLEWHPADLRWRDDVRDNAAVLSGDVVLRFGWRAVVGDPCESAAQVAAVLLARGWTGRPRACRPGCPVGRLL